MGSPVPFGRYFLLEALATGGMAELFLAKSTGEGGFEKLCVIKRVLPHLGTNSEFVEMFLDEARLAAQLNHPSIVQIFDLGRVNDSYFFAMEYLVGEDVAHMLQRAAELDVRLKPELVAGIVSLAADALHFAHTFHDDKGKPLSVVHRDISPGNLFVTYAGAVKVLDFGIARAESRIYQTREGQVRGKLHYMSPEQANGEDVDARTDVWALGVCLYEMLTGKRPFVGETMVETTAKVLAGRYVPLLELRPDCPPPLVDVVSRALEPSLQKRFASADELRQALEAACPGTLPTPTQLGQALRMLMGTQTYESKQRRTVAAERTELPRTPVLVADLPEVSTQKEQLDVSRRRVWPWRVAAVVLALVLATGGGVLAANHLSTHSGGVAAAPSAAAVVLPTAAVVLPTVAVDAGVTPLAASETTAKPDAGVTTAVLEPPPPATVATHTRKTGVVDVASNVPATVFLGERHLGSTPLRHLVLPVGEQTLRLQARTGAERSRTVGVTPNGVGHVRVSFSSGTLNVLVKPWADVYVDGQHAGQTPIAALSLLEGRHNLRLVNPSGQKTVTVDVQPGKTAVLTEHVP